MNWREFVASVIGTLAWPVVALVLLLLLRRQIGGLAERIQEFSLPGGAHAKFATRLEDAKEDAEVLVKTEQAAKPKALPKELLDLAHTSPEQAVVSSFADLERLVFDLQARLARAFPAPPRQAGGSTVSRLVQLGLIDEAAANLYRNLREARNSAVHSRTTISEKEALDYLEQARTLSEVLVRVLEDLPE